MSAMGNGGPFSGKARLAAACLAFLAFLAFQSGCEKKASGTRTARIGPSSSAEPASGTSRSGLDGFYVNREYYEGLKSNLSIFGTRLPAGSVYLQVSGDSAELDYNNHEGLMAEVRPLAESASIPRSGQETPFHAIALGPVRDSLYLAWESGLDAPTEFVRLGGIGNLYGLYGALLLDGTYACANRPLCGDTIIIRGDSAYGFPGGPRHLKLTIDWLDNLPQMDYFVLSRGDTLWHYAFAVSKQGLELHRIDLPAGCRAFEDYQCPLADAKRGARAFALRRIPVAGK